MAEQQAAGMKLLSDIRVVDFTQVIAGPFATYQLACMGAQVIKVEQPGGGDQGRVMMAPTAESAAAGMSALFTAVNAGKRSLTLNLKHPGSHEVLARLVSRADVVIENFKAGTMERLGLDEATLRAWNPRIVLCRISGFGQSGPRAGSGAYDPVVQAISGMMGVNGSGEEGPMKVGFWVVDMSTGMNAALSVAAALHAREAGGEQAPGATLDVSMLDTAISMLSPLVNLQLNYGVEPPYTGNGTPGSGGASNVYGTSDGHIIAAAATDAQFRAMVAELGLMHLGEDPRFARRADRLANSAELRPLLNAAFGTDSSASWVKRLADIGVPGGEVKHISELRDEAQTRHRRQFHELETPSGLEQGFKSINPGFLANGEVVAAAAPPPAAGQHTDTILTELGYDAAQMAALREAGITAPAGN